MSEFKFDSYQDFRAGTRFVEALLDWLQQFESADRETAYALVKDHLIFISLSELHHLVQRAFPAFVRPLQINRAARKLDVPKYLVSATKKSLGCIEEIHKRSLFVGLSDGARLDSFRRANAGFVNNEQVVLGYEISDEKWRDVHKELKKRTKDEGARFELIVLLDDFAGSGMTLVRWDATEQKWKGKLPKISESLAKRADFFTPDCDVLVHHYIGTEKARHDIHGRLGTARSSQALNNLFAGDFRCTFDLEIPNSVALSANKNPTVDKLLHKYYDPNIMTDSLKLGGDDVEHGFAGCGLPLIMEHNTPNNSLGILWAESAPGVQAPVHSMRPLFRRRQRHF
jgi:hypothetical protein